MVGVKVKIDRSKLVVGARVALDQTTLTIMRVLPREVDPMVFNMMSEDPGKVLDPAGSESDPIYFKHVRKFYENAL